MSWAVSPAGEAHPPHLEKVLQERSAARDVAQPVVLGHVLEARRGGDAFVGRISSSRKNFLAPQGEHFAGWQFLLLPSSFELDLLHQPFAFCHMRNSSPDRGAWPFLLL